MENLKISVTLKVPSFCLTFWKRKNGSKTKERTKEEEIEIKRVSFGLGAAVAGSNPAVRLFFLSFFLFHYFSFCFPIDAVHHVQAESKDCGNPSTGQDHLYARQSEEGKWSVICETGYELKLPGALRCNTTTGKWMHRPSCKKGTLAMKCRVWFCLFSRCVWPVFVRVAWGGGYAWQTFGRERVKGALSRGSAGCEAVEKFTHCRPSLSPWISSILGHPTLKPTRMLSFLPEHHEDIFFSIFFLVLKNVLDRCSSDQLCMSAVQCLRRGGGFWQFVKHLLRIEQKRQDGLADSSDGRSELDGESKVSDFSPTATIDQRFFSSLWWNLLASGDGNKDDCCTVHVVFTMSKLRRLCL